MDNNTIEASSSPPSSSSPSNHIGVGVPDLNRAVKWYHEVLGFNIVTEPMEGSDDNSHIDPALINENIIFEIPHITWWYFFMNQHYNTHLINFLLCSYLYPFIIFNRTITSFV